MPPELNKAVNAINELSEIFVAAQNRAMNDRDLETFRVFSNAHVAIATACKAIAETIASGYFDRDLAKSPSPSPAEA